MRVNKSTDDVTIYLLLEIDSVIISDELDSLIIECANDSRIILSIPEASLVTRRLTDLLLFGGRELATKLREEIEEATSDEETDTPME